MTFEPEYKVTIQDRAFVLTKSMIEFDSPNYFTTCFLGHYSESHSRSAELHRDPDLFRIVLSYLCGYSVLPLDESMIPKNMSPGRALRNLRADAVFYQLDGLVQACDVYLKRRGIDDPPRRYLVLGGLGPFFRPSDDENDIGKYPKFVMVSSWQLYVDADALTREPLNWMNKSVESLDDIYLAGTVERFVSESIEKYEPERYRVLGWYMKTSQRRFSNFVVEAFVVCEDLRMEAD